MNKKHIILISLVLLMLSQALPGNTREETEIKGFCLMPFVGFLSGFEFGTLIPLPNTADVPEITVQSKNRGVRSGFHLGYRINKHIELQGTFIYGLSEFQEDAGIGLGGFPLGIVKVADVKSFSYTGNILYSIPFRCLSVNMMGGLGAITLKPDVLANKTKLLLNFGAGLMMHPVKHLRLFLDVRDSVSFFDFAQDFEVFYTAIYDQVFKKSQHCLGIYLGAGYVF